MKSVWRKKKRRGSLLALTCAGGISTKNVLAWGSCIVHSQTFGEYHACRPYLCTEQEAPGTNHPFHSHCYHPSNARFGEREDAIGPLLLYAERMNKKAAVLPLPQKKLPFILTRERNVTEKEEERSAKLRETEIDD